MRPTRQKAIRELLKSNSDGLSQQYISEKLNIQISNVRTAIKGMPDVYLDRWDRKIGGQYQKIYVCVYVPEDCPHPKDMIYKGGNGRPKTVWREIA